MGATYMDLTRNICVQCPYGYDYDTTDGKTDVSQCKTKCAAGQYVSEPRLASDGKAHIDTGIISTGRTYVELVFQFTVKPNMSNSDNVYAVWGGIPKNYTNNSTGAITPRISMGAHMNKFFAGVNSTNYLAPFDTDIHSFTMNAATGEVTFDGVKKKVVTHTKMVMPFSSYLYARQTNTGPDTITAGLIIYQYREYDYYGGTLLRDMVPSVDPDGVVCMYDYVTQTYFYNQGEGEFARPYGCFDVGEGYWSEEAVVDYGQVSTRNKCPSGLTTAGYGAGADEASDCGHILTIKDTPLYLRQNKKTEHALHFSVGGSTFYAHASSDKNAPGRLKISDGTTQYTIYDDISQANAQ